MTGFPSSQLKNHWYWRPGWHVGSRFYTWHVTFNDQPDVLALADGYREVLSEQPSLDVIPNEWLHLTMQGVGFVHDVSADAVDAIVSRARARCSDVEPMSLTIGPPHIDPESIQIAIDPPDPVRKLRRAIRAAIGDVWGDDHVPEQSEPYAPHMSLAYVNTDGPAEPLAQALEKIPSLSAGALITSCQLIVLNRDKGMYVWEPYATVQLGSKS
jgi:2'-5' RNA ligase